MEGIGGDACSSMHHRNNAERGRDSFQSPERRECIPEHASQEERGTISK
jgi:hypothetical protein